MSIVHMDGFDSYVNVADLGVEYTMYSSSNVAVNTSAGRFGASGLVFNSTSGSGIGRYIASTTQVWVGYAANLTAFNSLNSVLFHVYGTAGAECTVTYYNGILKVVRGTGSGTVVGTYSVTISTGVWHWFEFHYTYGTSSGVCEVWMDGVQLCAFSGNTTNAGSGSIAAVAIGCGTPSGSGLYGFTGTVDDLYIIDVAAGGANTTRLGDSKIETLVPTSNAGPNDGTASAGSNYQCVDDATLDTADYVTITNTTGQEELYGVGALSSSPYAIFATRAVLVSTKVDAGPAFIKPVVVSGGTEVDGVAQPVLYPSWARQYTIYETDPHTSAAWTMSALNAAKVGAKVA
jgi:hypothetical protein